MCFFPFSTAKIPQFPKFHHIPLPPTSLSSSLSLTLTLPESPLFVWLCSILYPLSSNKPDVCCGRPSCIDSSIKHVFPHGLEEGKRRFVCHAFTFAHFSSTFALHCDFIWMLSPLFHVLHYTSRKEKKSPFWFGNTPLLPPDP